MANGRSKGSKGDSGRDSGGFVALPWTVLDCASYARLSHPARSLLWEFARQFVRDNNGRLLASSAYLKKRGWNSHAVIQRATRELVEAGFIHQTVMGHRPNKASWFAVTWRALDKLLGYDAGAAETFRRGAYQNAPLIPSRGVERPSIAPSGGAGGRRSIPSGGSIRPVLQARSIPSHGNHLEMPSPAAFPASLRQLLSPSEHGRYVQLRPSPPKLFTSLLGATQPEPITA